MRVKRSWAAVVGAIAAALIGLLAWWMSGDATKPGGGGKPQPYDPDSGQYVPTNK